MSRWRYPMMTPSQRRAINQIIKFYRERNRYNGVTSVRCTVKHEHFFVSLTIQTRRSDCSQYSPRAVFSLQYAHVFIGKRGGISVPMALDGVTDAKAERVRVERMLRRL